MKFIWTPEDIICGRIVCKKPYESGMDKGWYAKHTYKIGWLAGGNSEKDYTIPKGLNSEQREEYLNNNRADYCLIAMTDGMIGLPKTKIEIVTWLNAGEMRPAPHSHVMEIMEYLRNCYEK